jgi:DnaJ-class molecular chaperone
MDVEIPNRCLACYGSGFCNRCKGNGRYVPHGSHAFRPCHDCAGSGVCPECDGTGRVLPEAEDD